MSWPKAKLPESTKLELIYAKGGCPKRIRRPSLALLVWYADKFRAGNCPRAGFMVS